MDTDHQVDAEARRWLPRDSANAVLIARLQVPDRRAPVVAAVRGDLLVDLSGMAVTVSELLDLPDVVGAIQAVEGARTWFLDDVVTASLTAAESDAAPRLLAPIDLQVVKACGVTFADSLLERVIEERAAGDPAAADSIRERLGATLGRELREIRPGSPEAAALKAALVSEGMWSQYLEVGIGPDPEVFTKAPVLSSVGFGSRIGVRADSDWNNPEPELVLVMDSRGRPVGATLGNDVNLRDFEGRSALLLGAAKDNNASCAIGPFLRLFTADFGLDDLRAEEIELRVTGDDGFELAGLNSLSRISRPFEELIAAAHGDHHQYPDGFALFTGTLFAPVDDRGEAGQGFTHRPGDTVTIRSASLGGLVNTVGISEELPPWSFGIRALMAALADDARNSFDFVH